MKIKNLKNRLITSIFLIILLYFSFNYAYILIISLILISIISWIEFQGLISKIFIKNNFKSSFLKIIIKGVSLLYLIIFSIMVFSGIFQDNFKLGILFLVSVCICSDIGGLLFGNFRKNFRSSLVLELLWKDKINYEFKNFSVPVKKIFFFTIIKKYLSYLVRTNKLVSLLLIVLVFVYLIF